MKPLDEERFRKFPGLESLTDEQAQKIIAGLQTLSLILLQTVMKTDSKLDSEPKFIEPKSSDNQTLNREEDNSVD